MAQSWLLGCEEKKSLHLRAIEPVVQTTHSSYSLLITPLFLSYIGQGKVSLRPLASSGSFPFWSLARIFLFS
jgi:hypothetical protein